MSDRRTKLTEEQVREIRERRMAGEPLKNIASDLGVSKTCVCQICLGTRRNFKESVLQELTRKLADAQDEIKSLKQLVRQGGEAHWNAIYNGSFKDVKKIPNLA